MIATRKKGFLRRLNRAKKRFPTAFAPTPRPVATDRPTYYFRSYPPYASLTKLPPRVKDDNSVNQAARIRHALAGGEEMTHEGRPVRHARSKGGKLQLRVGGRWINHELSEVTS
jgi:hypothetical protein